MSQKSQKDNLSVKVRWKLEHRDLSTFVDIWNPRCCGGIVGESQNCPHGFVFICLGLLIIIHINIDDY